MNSKQLTVGNESEITIEEFLRQKHYYVYVTPKKVGGQPVDIIALKNDTNWLLDAKHVREEECSFTFNRIEPNQIVSLDYAYNWAGIENRGFAIIFDRDSSIRYLSYQKWLEMDKNGLKSVNLNELPLLEDIVNV